MTKLCADDLHHIGHLMVHSDRISEDDHGRLIEFPQLLTQLDDLKFAFMQLGESMLSLHEIGVSKGCYAASIYALPDLIDPTTRISMLLDRLDEDKDALEANRDELVPLSAAGCGVSAGSYRVLSLTSALAAQGHPPEVILLDGTARKMPAPDPLAIAAVVLDPSDKPRKIDGAIAGIGRAQEGGTWICLSRGPRILVPGLSLADAWGLLTEEMAVHGVAKMVEGELVLTEWDFAPAAATLI